MKWYNPYNVRGKWYRGNTHLHTFHGPVDSIKTDPAIIIDWYRAHGYHFLNFSDHCHITCPKQRYSDFITFAGHESDCVVAIDVDERPDLDDATIDVRLDKLQFWVDDIVARGGIAQIAHPKATLVDWQKNLNYLKSLDGVSLIELYNNRQGDYGGTINWRNSNKYAVEMWDKLLLAGKVIWPTAVDDSHDYLSRPQITGTDNEGLERAWVPVTNQDEQFFESGGGWMAVLAEELTPMHLKLAIRRGSVYASQGPVFKSIKIVDKKLVAKTDKAYTIRLIIDGKCSCEHSTASLNIDLPSCENRKYFRIEMRDDVGRCAWSAPFLAYQ